MIDGFLVLDAEWRGDRSHQRAILEIGKEAGIKADDNQCLGRWVSVAVLPV